MELANQLISMGENSDFTIKTVTIFVWLIFGLEWLTSIALSSDG